jgi:L-ascorbate metabolism protein UlaG (beta-lactamase superfamily)
MYKIISSSSKGNSICYFDIILVDIGVSYAKVKKYLPKIEYILLTHIHQDHLRVSVANRIGKEHPHIVFIGLEEVIDTIDVDNKIAITSGVLYDLGNVEISAVDLQHDVSNIGYRIFKDDKSIIHITDTDTLDGIEAVDYSLYAIEHNYDEVLISRAIERKQINGEYCHELRSVQSHLSYSQA